MSIFIPILFVCFNGHCEFMQTRVFFKTEEQCWSALEDQRVRLIEMSGGKIDTLEGTCITARIPDYRNQT